MRSRNLVLHAQGVTLPEVVSVIGVTALLEYNERRSGEELWRL